MGTVLSNQTSLNTSLTDIIASQATNNSSNCSTNTDINQKINLKFTSCGGEVNISKVSNSGTSNVQAQCEFKNLNKNSIENTLTNNLKNSASNSTSGMQLGNGVDTNQFVSNFIQNNVDLNSYISNITSCVNNFNSDQSIDITVDSCKGTGTGGKITATDISNSINVGIINKCTGDNQSFQDTQNTLQNIASASTDNTTKGIDPLIMFLLVPILLGVGGFILLIAFIVFISKCAPLLKEAAKHPKVVFGLVFFIILIIVIGIIAGILCNPNKQKETATEIAKDTIRQLGGGSGFIASDGTRQKTAKGDNIDPPVWEGNTLISGQQAQIGINYDGNLICYESKTINGNQNMTPIGSACMINSGAYVCFSDNISGKITDPQDSSKQISYAGLYRGKTCMDIATKNYKNIQPPIFCMFNCDCDKTPDTPINNNIISPPIENMPNYSDMNFNNNSCTSTVSE